MSAHPLLPAIEHRTSGLAPTPAPPTAPGELRRDPLTGRWAAIAAGRAARPQAFLHDEVPPRGPFGCPFCPGHEHMTPPELWADRAPDSAADGPGWRVRVVPNKFPAFAGAGGLPTGNGLYLAGPTAGGHEVVIHSPDHSASLADMDDGHVARVLAAYRARLAAHAGPQVGSVVIVVNQGRISGASLEHPHSQIFATAARPPLLRTELKRLSGPGCAACRMLQAESGGPRVVEAAAELVALCPWASTAPFEGLLLPAQHGGGLEQLGEDAELTLAGAVRRLVARLAAAVGGSPPYNLVLHTAPPGTADFHWHLHLYPRLTSFGGFELGTGVVINVVDPDAAAGLLRAAAVG